MSVGKDWFRIRLRPLLMAEIAGHEWGNFVILVPVPLGWSGAKGEPAGAGAGLVGNSFVFRLALGWRCYANSDRG